MAKNNLAERPLPPFQLEYACSSRNVLICGTVKLLMLCDVGFCHIEKCFIPPEKFRPDRQKYSVCFPAKCVEHLQCGMLFFMFISVIENIQEFIKVTKPSSKMYCKDFTLTK